MSLKHKIPFFTSSPPTGKYILGLMMYLVEGRGLRPWAVNFGEHFDIIRYLGVIWVIKKNNGTQITWGAKFL